METTDFKNPSQIAEATREAVLATANGSDAYLANDGVYREPTEKARTLVERMKAQACHMKEQGEHYVAEQPMRSLMLAAAGGAALTTLMFAALRGGSRH